MCKLETEMEGNLLKLYMDKKKIKLTISFIKVYCIVALSVLSYPRPLVTIQINNQK